MLIFTPYILQTSWYAEKSTLVRLGSSEIMVTVSLF